MGSGLDGIYSELINDLPSEPEKKLTKKQHKEMVLKLVKEKCPNLVKMVNELDLFIEGFGTLVDEKKYKLENINEELDEIEQLEEELEERKQRLDI